MKPCFVKIRARTLQENPTWNRFLNIHHCYYMFSHDKKMDNYLILCGDGVSCSVGRNEFYIPRKKRANR